jgi:3-deoxy-D-manno-octulosonic-acid transferase
VGGGVRGAVHNVMEPAAFGVPILTGPRIRRSWAAMAMVASAGLFPVADVAAVVTVLEHLLGGDAGREAGARARAVLLAHAGATERTLRALDEVGWSGQTAEVAEAVRTN